MRSPEDVSVMPEPGIARRLTRSLATGIVVLGSAGIGYAASCAWPLPSSVVPIMHFASTGDASAEGAELGKGAPVALSKPTATVEPSVSLDVSPQPPLVVSARLPDPVQAEASGSADPRPTSQIALSQTLPAHGGASTTPTTSADTGKHKDTTGAGRRAARAKVSRVVRTRAAAPEQTAVVEFAPNPRPNQPLRDFMTSRPANN